MLTAALMGPLFYRRWFSREALDAPFVHSVVRHILGARDPTPASTSHPGQSFLRTPLTAVLRSRCACCAR